MATSHVDRQDPSASHPYLDWALATRFAFLRPGDWVPLLVEYDARQLPLGERGERDTITQRFTRAEWLLPELREWIYVPPLVVDLAGAVRALERLQLAILLLEREHARRIVEDPSWRSTIVRAEVGPPVVLRDKRAAPGSVSLPAAIGQGTGPQGRVERVVIGVIDQGIAFAHARFRHRQGTRIAYLWQQEYLAGDSPTALGTEITAAAIDQALKDAHGDEDTVYRTLGGLRFDLDGYKPLGRRRTHGTHVLDRAAGAAVDDHVIDRPIIAVDMPELAIGDPAASSLTPHAIWGLLYILWRANSMLKAGETLPVVVNISYGPHEGPHDGTSLFERFADVLVESTKSTATPLQIVLAAGNFRQSRVHAQVALQPGQRQTLHWRLQPCSRTPSALELWWPAGHALSVTLRSPTNQLVSVSMAQPKDEHAAQGGVDFAAYQDVPIGATRARCVLAIAPTERDPRVPDGHAVAASGVWTVEIANDASTAVTVKGWIKRSDTPSGRRAKGRQSYFDEAGYRRYDSTTRPVHDDTQNASPVRRLGSLSGIATGCHTTVVGGYRRSDGTPAAYSSAGPHDNAQREDPSPTLLAASDDSAVLHGVLAAGTRSGSVVRISGTSVAAPAVTRSIAERWLATRAPPNLVGPPPLKPPAAVGAAAAELPYVAGRGLLG